MVCNVAVYIRVLPAAPAAKRKVPSGFSMIVGVIEDVGRLLGAGKSTRRCVRLERTELVRQGHEHGEGRRPEFAIPGRLKSSSWGAIGHLQKT